VTDLLHADLTGVSVSGTGWACDTSALPLVTCTVGSLAVGPAPDIVIAATAPITTSVITNTAGVTATVSDPDLLNNSAVVTTTVDEMPIAGLAAFNDSPTALGNPTNLWATVTAGSNVSYAWNFGDTLTAPGNPVSHTYALTGTYTAVVTATNSRGSMTATTQVQVIEWYGLYLPLVMRNYAVAPDLVVDGVIATSNAVTVTIRNQGPAPVEDEFWVDVYIDPDTPPTQVNQTWQHVGSQGLVWGVTAAALPLQPGDVLTLTVNDAYYWPTESAVTWPLPAGTPVYAQVDSAHAATTYGGVMEDHEIIGGPYNNIIGPVSSTGVTGAALPPVEDGSRPDSTGSLPPR
jgi:PKD repeat protein